MADQTIKIRIREIVVERYDIKTFVFERLDGQLLEYRAGQFLTFLLPLHGNIVRRSYSFSSAPEIDEFPTITIKRVANGEASRYWIDIAKVGEVFNVLPAAGRFVLDHMQASGTHDVILIGAGSGITPLFSLLKETLTRDSDTFVTLIYANKNESSTVFFNELNKWKTNYPHRLDIVHIHSQPGDAWTGIQGRINNSRLVHLVGKHIKFDIREAKVFICGPSELMRTVEISLIFMGISADQIRKENFVIIPLPPPPPDSKPHWIKLTFKDLDHRIVVPAHSTVLEAALAEGIELPYSCKGGRCSTCAGICTNGELHMTVNEVLTDKDLADGWVLTCSAYVDNDEVEIRIP